ncbi:unnamed protein product, partial [Polarella glacialis]
MAAASKSPEERPTAALFTQPSSASMRSSWSTPSLTGRNLGPTLPAAAAQAAARLHHRLEHAHSQPLILAIPATTTATRATTRTTTTATTCASHAAAGKVASRQACLVAPAVRQPASSVRLQSHRAELQGERQPLQSHFADSNNHPLQSWSNSSHLLQSWGNQSDGNHGSSLETLKSQASQQASRIAQAKAREAALCTALRQQLAERERGRLESERAAEAVRSTAAKHEEALAAATEREAALLSELKAELRLKRSQSQLLSLSERGVLQRHSVGGTLGPPLVVSPRSSVVSPLSPAASPRPVQLTSPRCQVAETPRSRLTSTELREMLPPALRASPKTEVFTDEPGGVNESKPVLGPRCADVRRNEPLLRATSAGVYAAAGAGLPNRASGRGCIISATSTVPLKHRDIRSAGAARVVAAVPARYVLDAAGRAEIRAAAVVRSRTYPRPRSCAKRSPLSPGGCSQSVPSKGDAVVPDADFSFMASAETSRMPFSHASFEDDQNCNAASKLYPLLSETCSTDCTGHDLAVIKEPGTAACRSTDAGASDMTQACLASQELEPEFNDMERGKQDPPVDQEAEEEAEDMVSEDEGEAGRLPEEGEAKEEKEVDEPTGQTSSQASTEAGGVGHTTAAWDASLQRITLRDQQDSLAETSRCPFLMESHSICEAAARRSEAHQAALVEAQGREASLLEELRKQQ